ncbi:MAG: hypothetical protein II625_05245 [Bacilli bacterium]|nr:hypothetical protein [Bacilli bacterium]
MKKRYLVVILLLMLLSIKVSALTVGDCKVLVSFKLNSSLDEDSYICKGTSYGNEGDKIYYSGTGNTISMNNFDAYYFTNWDENVELVIKGINNIQFLHISELPVEVSGSGLLKFKQNSFAKMVINGDAVNQYLYNHKVILTEDKKIFEGTVKEFVDNYDSLKDINKLPSEYNEADYELVQVEDYTKMASLAITDSWFTNRIKTSLSTYVEDGYGIVKYVEPVKEVQEEKKDSKENVLQTDNVVLITEKKVNKKYKLKEENLKSTPVAQQLSDSLDEGKDLVSFYDVSVYDGSRIVEMKNGKYIIKIKIDAEEKDYENYQIIYVNDAGDIEEYIDGVVEDGYMVFETTHLSQYGVIADQVKISNSAITSPSKSFNFALLAKISILVSLVIVSSGILLFLEYKSKHLKKKTRKRA